MGKYIFTILSKIKTQLIKNRRRIFIGGGTSVYYKCRICVFDVSINVGKNCLIGRSAKNYHAGMPFYTTLLNVH